MSNVLKTHASRVAWFREVTELKVEQAYRRPWGVDPSPRPCLRKSPERKLAVKAMPSAGRSSVLT